VIDSQGHRIAALDSENHHIQTAAIHLRRFNTSEEQGQPYEDRLKVADEYYMLIATPFSYQGGLEWTVVTVIPESDFLTEAKAAHQRSLLITLTAVLLTLVIGWWFARQMVVSFR
jgi:hypothetical protein